jgi:hypothetical protein
MTSSVVGGSQFSVDNIRNNNLFDNISRAEMMEQLKAEVRPMGYTGRIQANSSANYAKNPRSELANTGVINRDINLYQYTGFKDDKYDASSRATQSASRFNYGYDRQVNKIYVDVSGQKIPNNHLRVIPNRSCMMNGAYPLTKPPYDANLERLSVELMGNPNDYSKSYIPSSANNYLKFKANKPKLTRQDLTNSAQQFAMSRPQNLANPIATATVAVEGFDPLASARQRQQARDQINQNLREARGIREGSPALSIQIPYLGQMGAMG